VGCHLFSSLLAIPWWWLAHPGVYINSVSNLPPDFLPILSILRGFLHFLGFPSTYRGKFDELFSFFVTCSQFLTMYNFELDYLHMCTIFVFTHGFVCSFFYIFLHTLSLCSCVRGKLICTLL
jgi:hypothetical protein